MKMFSRSLSAFQCAKNTFQDNPREKLYAELEDAETFLQWLKVAQQIDDLTGASKWRASNTSPLYEWKALGDHVRKLREAREAGHVERVTFLLRLCCHRDFCGISNPLLYTEALSGTKRLIEAFTHEVCAALRFVCYGATAPDFVTERKPLESIENWEPLSTAHQESKRQKREALESEDLWDSSDHFIRRSTGPRKNCQWPKISNAEKNTEVDMLKAAYRFNSRDMTYKKGSFGNHIPSSHVSGTATHCIDAPFFSSSSVTGTTCTGCTPPLQSGSCSSSHTVAVCPQPICHNTGVSATIRESSLRREEHTMLVQSGFDRLWRPRSRMPVSDETWGHPRRTNTLCQTDIEVSSDPSEPSHERRPMMRRGQDSAIIKPLTISTKEDMHTKLAGSSVAADSSRPTGYHAPKPEGYGFGSLLINRSPRASKDQHFAESVDGLIQHFEDTNCGEHCISARQGSRVSQCPFYTDIPERKMKASDKDRGHKPTSRQSISETIRFLETLRLSLGRTALCLSGGGSLAMYHMGVVKCLLNLDCLPRVISGTSGGAIVAGILAIHTDAELLSEMLRPDVVNRYNCRWFPPVAQQLRQLLLHGHMLISEEFEKTCKAYYGTVTFREAFSRTGRLVSIVVTPSWRSSGEALVLNCINTPDVFIWSAVIASCSLPGLLPPQELKAKGVNGEVLLYCPDGLKWLDGSLTQDIPMKELACLFNVKQIIVSQVNPHYTPFVMEKSHRESKLMGLLENLLTLDIKHRYTKLAKFNLIPKIFGQSMSTFWMLQEFEGNVTITPRAALIDWYRIIAQPTLEDMTDFLTKGEMRTWPHCPRIAQMLKVEKVLGKCWVDLTQHFRRSHHYRRLPARSSVPLRKPGSVSFKFGSPQSPHYQDMFKSPETTRRTVHRCRADVRLPYTNRKQMPLATTPDLMIMSTRHLCSHRRRHPYVRRRFAFHAARSSEPFGSRIFPCKQCKQLLSSNDYG